MFCTGTMGELVGVSKVDDKIIGDGSVGAMTKRLSEFFVQRTAIEGGQVAV
jgi:branched-chain amino acid aminotransferase